MKLVIDLNEEREDLISYVNELFKKSFNTIYISSNIFSLN